MELADEFRLVDEREVTEDWTPTKRIGVPCLIQQDGVSPVIILQILCNSWYENNMRWSEICGIAWANETSHIGSDRGQGEPKAKFAKICKRGRGGGQSRATRATTAPEQIRPNTNYRRRKGTGYTEGAEASPGQQGLVEELQHAPHTRKHAKQSPTGNWLFS